MIYVVDTSGRSSSADGKAYLNDGTANPITSHAAGGYRGLDVVILDGSGNQVTSFGGTQYVEDAASAGGESLALAGAVRQDAPASSTSADGDYTYLKTDSASRLWVAAVQSGTWNVGTVTTVTSITNVVHVDDNGGSLTVDNGGTFAVQDSQVIADNAAFTDGTSKLRMAGYVYDESAGPALSEDDAAAARVDSKRAQVLVIEDAAIRGRRAYVSDTGSLYVAAVQSGTWSINAVQSGSWTVDTELPAAASLTDSDSNYTAPTIGGALMLWDQGISKWFRARGTLAYGILSDVYRIQSVVHVDDNSGSLTVDNGGTFAVQANQGATGTLTNVSGSASSVTLLASNASRRQAVIVNDSSAVLYIKFGTTASTTSYTYRLDPYDTLEVENYTGRIDGIWASAAGYARVTEVS